MSYVKTAGIHHASDCKMSQICQRGLLYYHSEIFSIQSIPEKVGSAFGLLYGMFAAAIALQRHLKKGIAFEEGNTFCNNNVYVEFSDTSSLLHGHLYLIVVLFATFPYTDVFSRTVGETLLKCMCYISIPCFSRPRLLDLIFCMLIKVNATLRNMHCHFSTHCS